MARWNEEQDRWAGRGDRYGEDERRFRGERGEEGGWRGRDWRDEDRLGEGWRERGSEWTGEWRERGGGRWGDPDRGERTTQAGRHGTPERDYRRDWEQREMGRGGSGFGGSGQERYGERDRYGERWRGEGWRGEGAYGEARGGSPSGGWGGGSYGGGRGEYSTYGSSAGIGGWRSEEYRDDYGRDMGRYGREEYRGEYGRDTRYGREDERGPFERMGEKIREGVRKLTGKGPKGYRRSDDRVRDDVAERIARSSINAENVEVKVENGEVTLTGLVERREEKRMLEDIAEDVFGVIEVHNHIRVNRGQQAGQTSGTTAGTGTTGTGTTMSAQQGRTPTPSGQTPGRH